MVNKTEIRKQIKAKKKELSRQQVVDYSTQIAKRMIESDFYNEADVIYPYIAYNQEVITDLIIEDAWKKGKKVAVPTVVGDVMDFFYITNFDGLKKSDMGIPEPVPSDETLAKGSPKVLIIMPGLAFDRNFNRIGYGGGYYDKYLDSHKETEFLKVALTYDFQILPHLETEEHDYKVDAIVTQSEIIR
ncbi:5-formyltetrahydrofolate cyclo-ligase [Acetitomaculum ruminis DSM 5522]|uniref:5-formyltetrahydrofolate cyclo-ligase n=1 Tax=Acetitomaculum ruminis DSM 5522 TaxID=1120918 RepID=A0A1I0Z3Y9_9FIRM|nr:5-formyltetrahydrofolate cyclo-ligase [Acetitomaculum ruminis]SFB20459.1 5-formyltetrahydrofolate cyclo-ligase [Acetitomaculum ruminis DSM 5522]